MITYNDFQKLEIKIGTIKEAEKIEKSDKLIKLIVDLGEEELRTIVAGIGQKYSPEDLIDKQIPILTNLEPRELFGVLSNGMILAANDSDDLPVLLHPDKKIKSGSKIS
jgi:methionine--tRNA ligase beta chain